MTQEVNLKRSHCGRTYTRHGVSRASNRLPPNVRTKQGPTLVQWLKQMYLLGHIVWKMLPAGVGGGGVVHSR